jgi:hypothetical protein
MHEQLNPQSVPAMTLSRPTRSTWRRTRCATSSGCSMQFDRTSVTPGISSLPSGSGTCSKTDHSCAWRGFAASNWIAWGLTFQPWSTMSSSGTSQRCGPGVVAPTQVQAYLLGRDAEAVLVVRVEVAADEEADHTGRRGAHEAARRAVLQRGGLEARGASMSRTLIAALQAGVLRCLRTGSPAMRALERGCSSRSRKTWLVPEPPKPFSRSLDVRG